MLLGSDPSEDDDAYALQVAQTRAIVGELGRALRDAMAAAIAQAFHGPED